MRRDAQIKPSSALGILCERARRRLEREVIKRSRNPRPPSYPYLTGDGFRALAQHVHEKGPDGTTKTVDASKVMKGDIVFVQASCIEEFFIDVHPRIPLPYVLITHNGDSNIVDRHVRLIDDKIVHWFAQNALVAHPRITPIPIGLENASYAHAGRTAVFERLRRRGCPNKNRRVLAGFSVQTNPSERGPALEALRANRSVDMISAPLTERKYLETLQRYAAVASPRGNGEDCHRTWEALYLGTIPIVQPSRCMEYFRDLGLPIVFANSWDSVGPLDPTAPFDETPLFFDYWKKIIYAHSTRHG